MRYTIILAGNKAGFETSTRNADGSLSLRSGMPGASVTYAIEINNGGTHVSLRTVKGSVSIEKGLPI